MRIAEFEELLNEGDFGGGGVESAESAPVSEGNSQIRLSDWPIFSRLNTTGSLAGHFHYKPLLLAKFCSLNGPFHCKPLLIAKGRSPIGQFHIKPLLLAKCCSLIGPFLLKPLLLANCCSLIGPFHCQPLLNKCCSLICPFVRCTYQSFTTIPAPITSEPRFTVPAAIGT